MPDCCELLATNDTYPVQGFRCGENAFGFQFHPEVTLEMKGIWTLSRRRRAPEAAGRPAARRASLACMRSTIRRSTAGSTASSTAGWRADTRVAIRRSPQSTGTGRRSFSPPTNRG